MKSVMHIGMLSFIVKLHHPEHMASKGAVAEEEGAGALMGSPDSGIYHFFPCIGQIIAICSQLTAREAGKCEDYIWSIV